MTCQNCKSEIPEASNYCNLCGARQVTGVRRELLRSRRNSRIAGVCGGLGEYFDIDPTVVRVLWVALSVIPGCLVGGLVAYIAVWIIVPRAPKTVVALEPSARTS